MTPLLTRCKYNDPPIDHNKFNLTPPHPPGGGYSHFFFIRRLGPSIYHSPQKNIRNFKHAKKIFEILATQKNPPFCNLTLRKDPKMHRNDPKYSPILWWPPKKYPQNLYTPKKFIFLKTPKKYWNSKILTPKNDPSLRMNEISEYPPPLLAPPPPPHTHTFYTILSKCTTCILFSYSWCWFKQYFIQIICM